MSVQQIQLQLQGSEKIFSFLSCPREKRETTTGAAADGWPGPEPELRQPRLLLDIPSPFKTDFIETRVVGGGG